MVTLPERGTSALFFGQCHDVIVTQRDNPWIRYYSFEGGNKLTLVWEKPLPEGVKYSCYKCTTPSRKIILSWAGVMFVFNSDFSLLSQYSIPGAILAVMGDDYFLVSNYHTEASDKSDVLCVSKRLIAEPEKDVLTLSVPADGAYKRDDVLYAACAGDGHTAIVAIYQTFVDFLQSQW